MSLEEKYISIIDKIPSIASPIRKLTFSEKLKWTALILLIYFVMTQVLVYGINEDDVARLQFLEIVLGSTFGSLMTLGIGPIVTASIILQLLVGSKIIPWDTNTERGRTLFQGTQKILAFAFAFIQALVFVSLDAVPAEPGFFALVIVQLTIGGWLVVFMDELISKWGFGSGVGLFIVAGVSKGIIQGMFNPLTSEGTIPLPGENPVGAIPSAIIQFGQGQIIQSMFALLPVIATFLVLFLVVYTQSIKVEVPLAYGSLSGFGRRWPLKFFYTSNMPVILVAALLANIQLIARSLSGGNSWLGVFDPTSRRPIGGLVFYLLPPSGTAGQTLAIILISAAAFVMLGILISSILKKNSKKFGFLFAIIGVIIGFLIINNPALSGLTVFNFSDLVRMVVYSLFMIGGAVVFSLFWVQTSGMDAKSVSDQISSIGMYIPGARRDPRIIEAKLNKYIPQLTVLGGAAIGFVAAFADFTFAIGTGTGILLASMIIYQIYEEISMQHADDMPPILKKFFGA